MLFCDVIPLSHTANPVPPASPATSAGPSHIHSPTSAAQDTPCFGPHHIDGTSI